jgi:hypothetical protein
MTKKMLDKSRGIHGFQYTKLGDLIKVLTAVGEETNFDGMFTIDEGDLIYEYRIEETDGQYTKRLANEEDLKLLQHKARKEQYEKLKKEFE